MAKIELTINGVKYEDDVDPRLLLVHYLRDNLGLTGTKEGCSVGECGSCAVIMDGRLVNSCLVLAPQAAGSEIITIEGIHAPDGGPNDLQDNFITYGAVQCGICIPGMVIALALMIIPWLRSPNRSFYPFMIFISIIFMSMFNDDTFHSSVGTAFFSYFYTLFLITEDENEKDT